LRCSQSLLRLREAVEKTNYKTISSILDEDKEWLSCDNDTKKQLLSFYDSHSGLPYLYRPLELLQSSSQRTDAQRQETLDTFESLLRLGFPTTLEHGKPYSIWHSAFGLVSPHIIGSLLNILFRYCHEYGHISWQHATDSILDQAMRRPEIITAFIEYGADVHEVDQPLNTIDDIVMKAGSSEQKGLIETNEQMIKEWRPSLTVGTFIDALDSIG
jgi:hypothetical protein